MSDLFYRTNGRVEWLCPHDVGHTVAVPASHVDSVAWWTHGCDGCCMSEENQKAMLKATEVAKPPPDPPPPPPRIIQDY